ncbi:MAG: FtsW/RodA/SpoVE family cell cycle protein, partial [Bacillota bacterium]
MHWNNKLLKNLNIYIPLIVILLIAIGFIAISSAVEVNKPDSQGLIFLKKQAVSVVLGILGVLILQFYDYSVFKHYYEMIFLGIIGILTFILIFGEFVAGGKRWLMIGPVNFQPSELAKIMMILVFAAIMDQGDELKRLSGFLKPFLFLVIPFALIILQNDLGTALVLLVIFVIMLFSGGGNFKFIVLVFGGGFLLILLIILAHEFIGTPLPLLKDYQLDRLVVFIN